MSWFNRDSYYQNEINGAEIAVTNIMHSWCLHPNFLFNGIPEYSFKFGCTSVTELIFLFSLKDYRPAPPRKCLRSQRKSFKMIIERRIDFKRFLSRGRKLPLPIHTKILRIFSANCKIVFLQFKAE